MRCQLRGAAADRAIAALVAGQHDVVTRRQLIALGIGERSIDRRIAARRLRRIFRGVYTVRQGQIGRHGWWMAAVLLGGEGAILSHRPAAALLGIRRSAPGRAEVTLPRERRSRKAVLFHSARTAPDEVTVVEGIPVTTVPRTLFDLAAVLRPVQVEAAINEAEVLRLTDPLSLNEVLERYPRRQGSAAIRKILAAARIGASRTRSELEIAFLECLDAVGLPRPEMNAWIQVRGKWIQVDCLWREQRVIAELDSHEFHRTGEAFESDRARDRALSATEWRPIRITWLHIREPAPLESDLRELLSTARAGPVPALRDAGFLLPPALAS